MAHGTLMTSFISPLLNQREDEFGGSLENRMRFPMGVVRRIKEVCGSDFPVDVRFSADEFKEGGVTTKDSPLIAQRFVEAGADSINVSSAFYDNLHKSNDIMRNQEGWKRYIWLAVKRGVNVPTIACGGLRHPEFCERVLAEGDADFVGLGRSLLADPEWPSKAAQGKMENIRHCISCLVCLQHVFATGADRCAVNPDWGRKKDFTDIKPVAKAKKVMVIGAGPGGMEAARVAAMRGHEVTLYDKQKEMGGQLLVAAKPPGKEKLLWVRDFEETQLGQLKVKMELGTEVTPELVTRKKPDVVIVATGAEPAIPEIPGIRGKNVMTAPEVLGGEAEIAGRNVVVIGGGMMGCEVGEYLVDKANKVTIVARSSMMATDMEPLNRQGLMEALAEKEVTLINNKETEEILENGITVVDKRTGKTQFIEAEYIVIARGSQSISALADGLVDEVDELYAVGDCNEPRAIIDAIYEGSLIARRI